MVADDCLFLVETLQVMQDIISRTDGKRLIKKIR